MSFVRHVLPTMLGTSAMAASSNESGLGLLASCYGSSSESEDENSSPKFSTKRKWEAESPGVKKICRSSLDDSDVQFTKYVGVIEPDENIKQKNQLLPVPKSVAEMFTSQSTNSPRVDNPGIHQGRTRAFPHEVGNWVSYVYVPFDPGPVFSLFVQHLINACSPHLQMTSVDDFHISISRTVVMRHHWINAIVAALKKHLQGFRRFWTCLQTLEVYTNEQKTRTFLGLKSYRGFEQLKDAVEIVDRCFAEYNLLPFYKPPSFHMSLCWCVGDKTFELNSMMPDLQITCEEFFQKKGECRIFQVNNFQLKTGNKVFSLPFSCT